MAGFKGKYTYSVDEKGRISIPAKLRKNLSDEANNSFVVTRGLDGCLYLYPNDIWLQMEKDLKQQLNTYDPEERSFLRSLIVWANDVSLDKQQRVTIPTELLEFAAIKSSVVLLGTLDKIELWNPEKFNLYMGNIEPHYETIASKVMGRR